MTDALDKGYNEGRLAFRRYFAKYGPNVKQNDPRMPPNPYVGYYGVLWLNGFESELRRHVAFTPSTGGFRDIEERASPSLNARKSGSLLAGQSDAVSRSAIAGLMITTEAMVAETPREEGGPLPCLGRRRHGWYGLLIRVRTQ